MDGVAFRGAPYPTKALLFELMRQHSGANNGHLHLAFSWLHSRGWTSRDVIQRAKGNLLERGLIIQTRQGGLNLDASLFAVTWLDISNFVGLDIAAKDYHRGAWAFLDKLPAPNKNTLADPLNGKGSTGKRYSPIPPSGTAQAPTVPLAGIETAISVNFTVPPDGNNEYIATPCPPYSNGVGPAEAYRRASQGE
jgi:hypothetical protein